MHHRHRISRIHANGNRRLGESCWFLFPGPSSDLWGSGHEFQAPKPERQGLGSAPVHLPFPSNSKPPPNMCCSSDLRHLFCIFLLSCPHLATAFFLLATNLWSLKQGRRICDLVGDRIRYDLGDTQGCGIRMPFLSILGSDPWKTTRVAKKGHANLRSM